MTNLSISEQKERAENVFEEFSLTHVRKSLEAKAFPEGNVNQLKLQEAFAGIDHINVAEIQSILAKLKYQNIGILITDQNMGETLTVADRTYLLFEGRNLKIRTHQELADD
jgi:lipopolysaccharide export system ATP-binding protein